MVRGVKGSTMPFSTLLSLKLLPPILFEVLALSLSAQAHRLLAAV